MKQAITKVILLTLFIAVWAQAASRFELQQDYNAYKRNYLKAVLSDDKQKQIKYLNDLIYTGSQLRISTIKYKNELKRLNAKVETKKHTIKLQEQRKAIKPVSPVSKYTITNVEQTPNSITVSFARNISKRDVKFLEKRKGNLYEDVFQFRGKYKYAKPTKLKIRGIDKILIYQAKHNTLKIVARDNTNPRTVYSIKGNKVKITFLEVPKKQSGYKKVKSFGKVSTSDSKYNIKNLEQTSNSIIVTFNKKVTKKDIQFSEKRAGGSYDDIFVLKGRYKYASPTKIKFAGIDRVYVNQYKYNRLRITIRDRSNPKTVYIFDDKKLIIKFLDKENDRAISNNTALAKKRSNVNFSSKSKVIVVDPGHGGKDPGAVGKGKRKEKNVTLSISKKLVKILKARGYKVHITRNRDKYLRLRTRTNIANKNNAHLFISIHANAAHKSRVNKANGIETFFLSPARSERAKRVAAKENKGDMDAMNWSSKQSFLTVLNQGKITASNKLAIDIHKNMLFNIKKNYSKVVDGGVREGPFWVLVGAQMPSVLIEVGYISHPMEGKRMFTRKYQDLMAKGIANGIDAYFSKNE